jgi:hypothetical protein
VEGQETTTRNKKSKPEEQQTKQRNIDRAAESVAGQWSLLHHAAVMPHSTGAVVQSWTRQAISNNTPDGGVKGPAEEQRGTEGKQEQEQGKHTKGQGVKGNEPKWRRDETRTKTRKTRRKQETKTMEHQRQQWQGRRKQQSKTK